MRITSQQGEPITPEPVQDSLEQQYLDALKRCHSTLMETTALLRDVAVLGIDYANDPDSVDEDTFKEICANAVTLADSTERQFSLSDEEAT